jgi:hypothetical protein
MCLTPTPRVCILCAQHSVANARGWTVLDRLGMTAKLYTTFATDPAFAATDLWTRGDGVHWDWWATREMNKVLLALLKRVWT